MVLSALRLQTRRRLAISTAEAIVEAELTAAPGLTCDPYGDGEWETDCPDCNTVIGGTAMHD